MLAADISRGKTSLVAQLDAARRSTEDDATRAIGRDVRQSIAIFNDGAEPAGQSSRTVRGNVAHAHSRIFNDGDIAGTNNANRAARGRLNPAEAVVVAAEDNIAVEGRKISRAFRVNTGIGILLRDITRCTI